MTLNAGNGSRPRGFAVGDFNNDTHIDIVVINSGTNNADIFLGYGNMSFSHQANHSVGASPSSIGIGDFDNDGQLDIVVTNLDDSNISVLLGCGNGSFENQTTHSTGVNAQPYSILVSDFDNDNILNLMVANYAANNIVVLLGYGNGRFSNAKEVFLDYNSHPIAIIKGDFNKEKKLDFVVINEGTDTLKILLQTC